MVKKNGKRNSSQGIGRSRSSPGSPLLEVGGRQTASTTSHGGGGYQNICTVLNFEKNAEQKKRDPRLDELRQMGLQRVWLNIAEEVGVDNLLKVWRALDKDQSSIGDDGRLLVPIRSYSTFLRYQRNRYIETLDSMGMSAKQIQQKLSEQLCEQISLRHISRLAKQE
jgi:hypothetical protein